MTTQADTAFCPAPERLARLRDLHLPSTAVVVADAGLPREMLDSLPNPLCIEAGEGLKSLAAIEALAQQVLARRSARPLTLVAVGGGSLGDAVGFLASVLWRGVELWHVPTTLLAMVDSAHGGKTAVNLGAAKNQLGTFYPASRVVIAEDVLACLPLVQREQGLAEIIKALWLGDAEGLALLEAEGGVGALSSEPWTVCGSRLLALMERAIAVKRRVVEDDPREWTGQRAILNLGHTLGHALELRYGLSHGEAVAWGLACAAHLSRERAGLGEAGAARLQTHVYPLLHWHAAMMREVDAPALVQAMGRDKKTGPQGLRSILLKAPGEPLITTAVGAEDWVGALGEVLAQWRQKPVYVELPTGPDACRGRRVPPGVSASKSERNRLAIIAHLRPGSTEVAGQSEAQDVEDLARALAALKSCAPGAMPVLHAGEGGTTLRFLMALLATRPGPSRLYAHRRLVARPQQGLVQALEAGGARLTAVQESTGEQGWEIMGWPSFPERLVVPADQSSQYASALGLLSASGAAFTLELAHGGAMVSEPYFAMTLALLERAGVAVRREGHCVHFQPGPGLTQARQLWAEADQSSVAVWRVAAFLRPDRLEAPGSREDSLQPDAALSGILDRLGEASGTLTVDLAQSPDLAPVLAVAAALGSESAVELVGAAHLRLKESNRIDTFAEAMAAVGVQIEGRADGLYIPAGRQRPLPGARMATHGDHRLAMAALALSAMGEGLWVEDPWVVAKSYPELWRDARRLGWRIVPKE